MSQWNPIFPSLFSSFSVKLLIDCLLAFLYFLNPFQTFSCSCSQQGHYRPSGKSNDHFSTLVFISPSAKADFLPLEAVFIHKSSKTETLLPIDSALVYSLFVSLALSLNIRGSSGSALGHSKIGRKPYIKSFDYNNSHSQ